MKQKQTKNTKNKWNEKFFKKLRSFNQTGQKKEDPNNQI